MVNRQMSKYVEAHRKSQKKAKYFTIEQKILAFFDKKCYAEQESEVGSMAQRTPYRVAIALNSAEEQAWVQDRLEQSQGWQALFSTKDGETCLRQVLRDRPELVLIGDILRDMEGRELLRQLRLRGMAGKLVLITNSLQIASSADVRQDADLCLLRPYNMEQLLRWMAEQAEGPSAEQLARYERAEAEAAWLLRELQILPNWEGHAHICYAVALAVWDPGLLRRRGGDGSLYRLLCEQEGKALPYKTVEHRIRTLGQMIFCRNDKETLKKYFPSSAVERGRIRNLELIAALTQLVAAALQEEAAAQ